MTDLEKHAIVGAAAALEENGIEITLPWEGDQDDLERERYRGMLAACRAYYKTMMGAQSR